MSNGHDYREVRITGIDLGIGDWFMVLLKIFIASIPLYIVILIVSFMLAGMFMGAMGGMMDSPAL